MLFKLLVLGYVIQIACVGLCYSNLCFQASLLILSYIFYIIFQIAANNILKMF